MSADTGRDTSYVHNWWATGDSATNPIRVYERYYFPTWPANTRRSVIIGRRDARLFFPRRSARGRRGTWSTRRGPVEQKTLLPSSSTYCARLVPSSVILQQPTLRCSVSVEIHDLPAAFDQPSNPPSIVGAFESRPKTIFCPIIIQNRMFSPTHLNIFIYYLFSFFFEFINWVYVKTVINPSSGFKNERPKNNF